MSEGAILDTIRLNFGRGGLWVLNATLALVMFGVALDLRLADFREALKSPRAVLVGALAQALLLPALSFGLIVALQPSPSIALGMIMVAACPGGNMSNFLTHFARGDTPVSIALTAISTLGAVITTPFHLAFWGSRYPPAAPLLRTIELDPVSLGATIALVLLLPLALGMAVTAHRPALAVRLRRPMQRLSLGAFALFLVAALGANFGHFLDHIHLVFAVVAVHNALAFGLGWLVGRVGGVSAAARRTLTIEVGIQNTGLGLVLTFDFFGGLGGMAFVLAWWGVWHLLVGFAIASWWARRPAVAAG